MDTQRVGETTVSKVEPVPKASVTSHDAAGLNRVGFPTSRDSDDAVYQISAQAAVALSRALRMLLGWNRGSFLT